MKRPSLPIDAALPDILRKLAEAPSLVLQAEPGTGKTTRVPPALLEAPWARSVSGRPGEIWVLEPRRLAAKMAARRVAQEMGEAPGETVGYQFRFEKVTGPRTRVLYLTEGMLMRRLLAAPELPGVAAVLLDEFHERHLHGDVALAFLTRLQRERRPELRLVVMSATLDTETVGGYLEAPVLSVPGSRHEVIVRYLPSSGPTSAYAARGPGAQGPPLERQVRQAVEAALEAGDDAGDLLVFLPGMAEIRRCENELAELARRERLLVLPLHGELTREEQDRAVGPADRRKVILSTNVAETSLTIPGIRTVIDSGLARVAAHSAWTGLPTLRTRPVSRASAVQRAGRAGRTAPGQCLRLYAKADFEGRAPFEVPEVQRADLAQTVLELKSLGAGDLRVFPWFEAPRPSALDAAEALLLRLGALDRTGTITEIGRRLVRMPAHPRVGRLALAAQELGVSEDGVRLAALIAETRLETQDPIAALRAAGRGDFAARRLEDRLRDALRGSDRGVRTEAPFADEAKPADQVKPPGSTAPLAGRALPPEDAAARERALRQALLRAFPDRVARKRGGGAASHASEIELVLATGGSAWMENTAYTQGSDWFVALDAEERATGPRGAAGAPASSAARNPIRVRSLAPIEPEWLFDLEPVGVEERETVTYDSARGRVEAVSQIRYENLVLDESRGEPHDLEQAGRVLAEALLRDGGWAALVDPEALRALRVRYRLVRDQRRQAKGDAAVAGWPDWDDAGLEAALAEFCRGRMRAAEAREGGFLEFLQAALPDDARAALERGAPSHVQLPRGRRVAIRYEESQAPWIESRLQDFFGMRETPSILGGALPLTVHLLAPNQRAVQVTQDLAGFWQRHYPQQRRELGRRYPRHFWPEDPLNPGPEPARRSRGD